MATLKQAKPLAPNVKLMNPDGTPTRDFHNWLTRQYEHLTTPGAGSDFTPTEATIAAAGPPNRAITNLNAKNAVAPVTWSIIENPGAMAVRVLSIDGADATVSSTANPIGTVGQHFIKVSAIDGTGKSYTGVLKITLT